MRGQSGAAVRDDLSAMVGQLWRQLSVAYLPDLTDRGGFQGDKQEEAVEGE